MTEEGLFKKTVYQICIYEKYEVAGDICYIFIMVCDTRRPFSSAAVLDDMGNDLVLDIRCFRCSLSHL